MPVGETIFMARSTILPIWIAVILISSLMLVGLERDDLRAQEQSSGPAARAASIVSAFLLLDGGENPPLTCSDADGDGYGSPGSASCTHPQEDCDDTRAAVNPGALEGPYLDGTCSDVLDNDCDGLADAAADPDCWFPFAGGVYNFQLKAIPLVTSGIKQTPAGCLVSPALLFALVQAINVADVPIPILLPAFSAEPFLFELYLPYGMATLSLDNTRFGNNELTFQPLTVQQVDLGPVQDMIQQLIPEFSGFNCLLIAGSESAAEPGAVGGSLTPLDGSVPLSGDLNISHWRVETGSGEGECNPANINMNPDPSCTLTLTIEGTPWTPGQ